MPPHRTRNWPAFIPTLNFLCYFNVFNIKFSSACFIFIIYCMSSNRCCIILCLVIYYRPFVLCFSPSKIYPAPQSKLKDQFDGLPPSDFFNDFVTWTSLEDSLKGIREQMEENRNNLPPPVEEVPPPIPQRIVIEMSSQTEIVSCDCCVFVHGDTTVSLT